jgi:hypothetical protein
MISYLPAAFQRSLLIFGLWAVAHLSYGQRFAAIGDYGHAGRPELDVANLVKSWDPDLIITLGDNNYELGDSATIDQNIGQYYHSYIYNYKGRYGPSASTNRFFPALGNHDYYTNNGQPYRDYFTLPGNGRYYDFVRGDVHFFAIDSDPAEPDGIDANSVQAMWLKKRMSASTSRWKVVYMHHAPYSSSGHHGSNKVMQWPYQEWGASIVLAGHDHHYERLLVDGLPYFVNGLGGHSVKKVQKAPLPQNQAIFGDDFGAMLFNASPDSLVMQFFTRKRQLIDTYTIHQALSTTPTLYPITPNPFHDVTRVEFSLPTDAVVRVRILNTLGKEVTTLHQGPVKAGRHRLEWQRNGLPAGIYYVQLLGSDLSLVTRAVAY